jgi:Fe-S cluster biogenesis protein NfuA
MPALSDNFYTQSRQTRGGALSCDFRVRYWTVREQIESTLREVLKPLFEAEGGTVELVDIRDDVVLLRFGGSYRGCPSVPYTVAGFVLPAFRSATGSEFRVEVIT